MNNTRTRGLLLTTAEAAAALDVEQTVLAKWRRQGTGPAFIQLGRTIRYHPETITNWTSTK